MTDRSTERGAVQDPAERREAVDDSERAPESPSTAIVGSDQPQAMEAGGPAEPTQPHVGADERAGDEPPGGDVAAPRAVQRIGDRVFKAMAGGASGIVILIVLLVAVFLVWKAAPSIGDDQANFLTSTQFNVGNGHLRFGIAGLLYTTVLSSIVALILAVPLAIGIALFITQYAPRSLARPIAYAIDLLAAIPSIIYGVWGFRVLAPELTPVQSALAHIPLGLFSNQNIDVGTVFDAGIVLAIMILPIVTAISRDVFDRTPDANKEAALALGSTRWEMIRMAVLPYGRAGVISGAMLGLGRALGETIAVLLILSSVSGFSFSLFSGGTTFASLIAGGVGEFGKHPGPYIAAGLVLFILTFIVNAAARAVVARRKDFV